MRRLKTKFEYHDALLIDARWREEAVLELTFDLDGHWNVGFEHRPSLVFHGVRNRSAIKNQLQVIARRMTHDRWLADVVAFGKLSSRGFLVDTSQGALEIDAGSFEEL